MDTEAMKPSVADDGVGDERRQRGDRRLTDRRRRADAIRDRAATGVPAERRIAERRRELRRADDSAVLVCPNCSVSLQPDAAASWRLPGIYAVDAGRCPSCARLFLRNRSTGDYDEVAF